MPNYTSGEQFINKLYNNLINSEEVKRSVEKARKRGVKISNREDMLKAYFDRLEDVHDITRNRKLENANDSAENNEVIKESQIKLKLKVLKYFYYEKYVIKELPQDYIELQKKIAKERGYGNIDVTEEMKEKMLEEVRNGQKTSLDSWISYLISSDAMYPTWFKYYAFQGMLKLGKFDKEKGEFTKRTSSTVTPFIELNPEILGQMYNILQKTINKEELTDKEEQALSNGESFKKLYKYFLVGNYKDQENLEETKGVWIKYNQGDNYKSLWQSLQGKNTGWCTAGEVTCKEQVKKGDFYVYYTYDKEGNPTNPRIAIRMNGNNKIGEIRGIGPDQNLEPEMLPILNEKLNEFSDKDEYLKKEHDMKLLTEIDNKDQKGEELTKEELRFLYEIDSEIEGFGWQKDPRINEIKKKRNVKKDLSKYYKINDYLIAVTYNEIDLKTKIAYINNKFFSDEELLKYKELLKIYNTIKNERIIKDEFKEVIKKYENRSFETVSMFSFYHTTSNNKFYDIIKNIKKLFEYDNMAKRHGLTLQNVALSKEDLLKRDNMFIYVGDLKIEDTKVPDYLKSLKYIYGNVDFGKLESAEGLENLKVIHGDADFHSLKSGNGLCNLQEVFGEIDLSNVVDIGDFNQKIKITPKNEYVTYDAYSPPLILSEKFFTSENISNVKSNTRFEKYLINYYGDFYEKHSNVTYRRIYKGASEKELEKQLNTWAKEDALMNEDNLEEKNNVDYSSYRNLDDLIDYYERNGKWPEYIDNPVSNEDFINNELYEYRQELLEEEDYLDDDEREKLLDVDSSFFESYIY